MIRTPAGDTDFFDVDTGVLLENTLAPYMFKTFRDYELSASIDLIKENGFTLKKRKQKADDNPLEIMTDSSC